VYNDNFRVYKFFILLLTVLSVAVAQDFNNQPQENFEENKITEQCDKGPRHWCSSLM
jgi:hypothetical protein